MKKFLFFAAALLCVTTVNAKTWRINYDDNANADFKTLAAACASTRVKKGDVLYVEPCYHAGSASDNTISKAVTVIGPGWGFKDDAEVISAYSSAKFADNVLIEHDSVTVRGIYTLGTIYVGYSNWHSDYQNINIERCRAKIICFDNTLVAQHIVIRNNYVEGNINIAYPSRADYISIVGNIVLGQIRCNSNTESTLIDHNTIIYSPYSGSENCITNNGINTQIYNNIIINTNSSYKNTAICNFDASYPIRYNVFSIEASYVPQQADEGNNVYTALNTNHYIGATKENTFSGSVTQTMFDPAVTYQVMDGNAAKTADQNGGECGAFGGSYPYVLCGRPAGTPYLYDIAVPDKSVDNQLNVTFKVNASN